MRKLLGNINRIIPRTRKQLRKFWLNEKPEGYLLSKETEARTKFLVEKVKKLNPQNILEIGCNCGRNLKGLYDAGFKNLWGVEINPKALELLKRTYPINHDLRVLLTDINECGWIPETELTFTMAVLEHLPKLDFLNRLQTKYFITMEDERGKPRYWYFKHNYKKTFEDYGYIQLKEEPLDNILGKEFTYRLFRRIN